MVAPQYPAVESPRPAEGYVLVEFTITADGLVEEVKLVEAVVEIGDDRFESGFARSAIAAIQKWKFGTQLKACRTEMRFIFEIDENELEQLVVAAPRRIPGSESGDRCTSHSSLSCNLR